MLQPPHGTSWTVRWYWQWTWSEGFPHPGQCAQGCVEITSTVSSALLISTWPMTSPLGKGRNGDFSISIILLRRSNTSLASLSGVYQQTSLKNSKQTVFPKSWDEPVFHQRMAHYPLDVYNSIEGRKRTHDTLHHMPIFARLVVLSQVGVNTETCHGAAST